MKKGLIGPLLVVAGGVGKVLYDSMKEVRRNSQREKFLCDSCGDETYNIFRGNDYDRIFQEQDITELKYNSSLDLLVRKQIKDDEMCWKCFEVYKKVIINSFEETKSIMTKNSDSVDTISKNYKGKIKVDYKNTLEVSSAYYESKGDAINQLKRFAYSNGYDTIMNLSFSKDSIRDDYNYNYIHSVFMASGTCAKSKKHK